MNIQSYLGAHMDILQPLQNLGLGVDDYDTITRELPGSIITCVTQVQSGKYYMILQNRATSRVVQLLGNRDNYTIASQPIPYSSKL